MEQVDLIKNFEDKIQKGEKIEPKDWMPDEYRKNLTRMISQHAHSEIVGMLPEGNWISRAPSLRRKLILIAKVQDEGGHGLYLYNTAETLGATREEMIDALHSGKAKYSNIFNYPTLTWADMGAVGWLVDGAAMVNQVSLIRNSYGPYSRSMVRICKEEAFHNRQGYEIIATLCNGTKEQFQMAQDALDRWWWPSLMMFGPEEKDSTHTSQSMRWKIKLEGNEDLRQRFISMTVPQIEARGLQLPDTELKYNAETKKYEYGQINWDEFFNVINGRGFMNRERLEVRNAAHQEGNWVRNATVAYSQKHSQNHN